MSLIALALATVPAAVPAPASPPTSNQAKVPLQQLFDAATLLYGTGKYAEAAEAFRAIESRVNPTRAPAVLGAIRARMGYSLFQTGRSDEARAALESAVKLLPTNDATYRNDIREAEIALGMLDSGDLRPADAIRHLTTALPLADAPFEKVRVLILLAQARMFIDPAAAQVDADEAMRIATQTPGTSREVTGQVRTIRGRVLMNRGQAALALAELRKSVTEQGGLTMKVSLSDIISRSDLAIAALMSKDDDAAREYLAYTGAGRFEKAPFATARRASPPPCGGSSDLRPDDSAIVQFSIDDNGATRFVEPIWASRPGPVAIGFARAVREWSWAPAEVAKIPSFFRMVTRVELRCSNAASRPSVWASLTDATSQWLIQQGTAEVESTEPDAVALPKLVTELEKREKEGDPVKTLPVLFALIENAAAEPKQRNAWGDRAVALATQAKAPVTVEAPLRYFSSRFENAADARRALQNWVVEPRFAANPLVADTFTLAMADISPTDNSAEMIGWLNVVADDKRLPAQHPLRIGALVRLADRLATKGDLNGARTNYMRTGLDDTQCALVGSTPAVQSYSGSFPMEAQRWGFEGWVKFETDVASDGRSLNQRAVMAYPPFVFREAALKLARTMRFNKTYRPSGDAACSAYQSTVRFRIIK
ncbi:MAG: hypothetical protein V4530_01280 [Pseudomonadota bacterium]